MYVTHLEGALNAVQKDHPQMISKTELCNHLQDQLFCGLKCIMQFSVLHVWLSKEFPFSVGDCSSQGWVLEWR